MVNIRKRAKDYLDSKEYLLEFNMLTALENLFNLARERKLL